MQNINKLCVIQKRAIRTIHNSGYTEHRDPFLKSSNILPLENLQVLQVCIYIFKSVANVGSFNIFHKLHTFSSAHEYDTRDDDKFILPKYKLGKTQHNILYRGMRHFNLLPAHVRQSNNVNEFKTNIKKYNIMRSTV